MVGLVKDVKISLALCDSLRGRWEMKLLAPLNYLALKSCGSWEGGYNSGGNPSHSDNPCVSRVPSLSAPCEPANKDKSCHSHGQSRAQTLPSHPAGHAVITTLISQEKRGQL